MLSSASQPTRCRDGMRRGSCWPWHHSTGSWWLAGWTILASWSLPSRSPLKAMQQPSGAGYFSALSMARAAPCENPPIAILSGARPISQRSSMMPWMRWAESSASGKLQPKRGGLLPAPRGSSRISNQQVIRLPPLHETSAVGARGTTSLQGLQQESSKGSNSCLMVWLHLRSVSPSPCSQMSALRGGLSRSRTSPSALLPPSAKQ
mmetsp:Transcript_14886/g.43471  ORF Transcript_14886/g.43471 Transcript_14886/m.43471 type:complete len:206 (-) Transcript_14886:106-723(-)